jgi:ubiquinone/menaquinone biosynthesis C-methylase UbiE
MSAVNHWPDERCARAFWGQQELPPYQRLLADTCDWLGPRPGERWLDLGCGGGRLTRALWEKSGGGLSEVVALDCAAANGRALEKLRLSLEPPAAPARVRFVHADFSAGLAGCRDASFDGVVSGLAVQYAESWSQAEGRWTTDAYDRLLGEVCRVLRRGGCFVFSVNVPEPAWGRVGLSSFGGFFRSRHPLRYLKNAFRMWRYGWWLKRQARLGRFHFLPRDAVVARLAAAGFTSVEDRLSYAGQAYIFRCRR